LRIGATVTLEQAGPALASIDPDLGELIRRFGGWQVRNAATIGGNIANGSPIGDSPPALIALGARIELQRGDKRRTVALENFYIDYKKQDRAPGEFVRSVSVPKLAKDEHFRCFKLSKRYDQDISGVMGAIKLRLDGGKIAEALVAFGGMAGTPKRAKAVEEKLKGISVGDGAAIASALTAMSQDFSPLDDMRASKAYRLNTAQALVAKAIAEIAGAPSGATRVFGRRPDAHAA
jgi:xanthine dehydrogenase small subunit